MKSNIGIIIRTLRKERGYSQEYVAYRLKMSQNNFSKMERNLVPVTHQHLCQLLSLFEVKPATFFQNTSMM